MNIKQVLRCGLVVGLIFQAVAENVFDKEKDIFIAQFDSIPDSDDIHSQAAVGCLLAHPDFSEVNYFAVAGAYGSQVRSKKFHYIDSRSLFNLAFGAEALTTDSPEARKNARWVDAHARIINKVENGKLIRSPERITQMDFASEVVKERVKPILKAGGRVFVMEAGQSDFTADWVEKLIAEGVENTSENVILVQHSTWNEKYTTGNGKQRGGKILFSDEKDDWAYVNNPSILRYVKIEDGNDDYEKVKGRGDQTPSYKDAKTSFLEEAISLENPNSHAQKLWSLAKDIVSTSSYKGKVMTSGGVDFSDTVEAMWIFDLADKEAGLTTVRDFWDRFVVSVPEK